MLKDAVLVACIIALATTAAQGATSQDVATLKGLALDLGLPTGLWDFSVDPCVGRWPGVGCCSSHSRKACCHSPGVVYENPETLRLDCDTSQNASVAVLLLRSDAIDWTLNGTLSSAICNLTSLMLLDLGINNIGGRIPACIGGLTQLQILRLGGNRVDGTIPRELGSLSNLQELFLDSLQLTGDIPDSLGNLVGLSKLSLRSNHLRGSIPSTISGLVNVTLLALGNNQLTGELNGTALNGMQALQSLQLMSNDLSGQIPELALPALQLVELGFNKFTGHIPTFRNSEAVSQLFLGHNSLSGVIPSDFPSGTLTMLDISHNQLTGSVEELCVGACAASSANTQNNVAFNFFSDAGQVLGPSRLQSLFNCAPGPNCSRSSPGNTQSFAVNAGGEQVQGPEFDEDIKDPSSLGMFYSASFRWAMEVSGLSGGVFQDSTKTIQLAEDSEQVLYQSMRWSSNYIAYYGVGLASGNYTVTLYFAEIIFNQPGYRKFDVLLNGQVWKQRLDVIKEAGGPNTAYKISTTTYVNNGTLAVELIYPGKDVYIKMTMNNTGPMISAISVVHNDLLKDNGGSFKFKATVILVVGLVCMILGPCLGSLFWACHYWKTLGEMKRQEEQQQQVSVQRSNFGLQSRGIFTFQELYEATGRFVEKLGEGGFGVVYKGLLPSGVTIAVKQLIKQNKQTEEDFKREIAILTKLRHKHLLSVFGYSLESDVPMLVTEFMPNGSLNKWLHPQRPGRTSTDSLQQVLSWEARRNIAIGVANGLAYLHDESKHRIIHCDIKPANILLDSDMNPRLADFGLARLYEDEQASHVTATRLNGTAGYLAPEYAMHLQLSEKVDVYSFGVVLLELLSGRRPVEFSAPTEQLVLVEWVHKEAEIPANLLDIVDKRLENNYNEEQARDMAIVAVLCTQRKQALRPRMQTVWLMLNGTLKIPQFMAGLDRDAFANQASASNTVSFEHPFVRNAF